MVLELVIFATVTFGLMAAYLAAGELFNRDSAAVRRRLAEEFGAVEGPAKQQSLFKNLDKLDLDAETSDYSGLERLRPLAANPLRKWRDGLALWLEQADLHITPGRFLAACAALAALAALGGAVLAGPVLGAATGALGGAALPAYAHRRRTARRERFLQQLPSAFDLMARVIRGGQSVPQALQSVAESAEPPTAHEFAQCLHQQNFGLRPEVAFQEMAQRWGIAELRIFVMAMLIQRQTGGNLSEVLDRLAALIRARQRLRQQVRTLTAEGRLQGWTLCVLPLVMLGMLAFLNRGYVEVLLQQVPLLVGTGCLMGIGLLWIRNIVNVEI